MYFSIIIPAYNAEKTLNRCINSILAQTFSDYEIIIVNDGSTDNTKSIIDNYSGSNTKIIAIHKSNGGVSSARNEGIRHAQGEYIVFVDSDDEVTESYLESFYKFGYDCIITGVTVSKKQTTRTEVPDRISEIERSGFAAFINDYSHHSYIRGPYAKAFRHDIIKNFNLQFDEELHWSEDYLFLLKFMENSYKILLLNQSNYIYYAPEVDSKYKMGIREYMSGVLKVERSLLKLGNCPEALNLNRDWHYITFASNIKADSLKVKLNMLFSYFKNKIWKTFPKESNWDRFKRMAGLFRITLN